MNGLNELIGDHPAAVVIVFGFMWAVMMALIGFVRRMVIREFGQIEKREDQQDSRLRLIEQDIQGENSRLALMARDLSDHISREEEVWEKVDEIHDTVLRLNNGQMALVHHKLDNLERAVEKVDGKVEGHNAEAEGWKRKIEKNELRLDRIERGGRR